MGFDRHQQPNSSGTLVAVVGVALVLAVFDKVGGIAYSVVPPENADRPTELNNVTN